MIAFHGSGNDPVPRIAVCFFGITRSLRHTVAAIEENVLGPARQVGTVTVHGHFFRETHIENARTGERGTVDPEEHRLIPFDTLTIEEPDVWIDRDWQDGLKANGDYWDDDFSSFRNLIHQLHSLEQVTLAAIATRPDVIAFCRPDLWYHDSLGPGFRRAILAQTDVAFVPPWQHWQGGLNDRFAICAGRVAAEAYGCRIRSALHFVSQTGLPLHSERLVRFSLMTAGIRIKNLNARASRVRVGGVIEDEDFSLKWWRRLKHRRRFLKAIR